MAGIRFAFAEVFRELEAARNLTREFTENGDSVFSQVKTLLEGIQGEASQSVLDWEIPKQAPLRIKHSNGEHEIGGGGIHVASDFTFLWQVKKITGGRRRREPAKDFELSGKATAVAHVFALDPQGNRGDKIAMWRMEIGDDHSPGCHFHVQILGEENSGPFPRSLAVPRLPTCMTSPLAALEFLLAELFQEVWRKHVSAETEALKSWRVIQRTRLQKLFAWHSETIEKSRDASPWPTLKYAKPPANIFLS